jgi:FtsP/CotA-like multicopper oxidase with cupredoxin domain
MEVSMIRKQIYRGSLAAALFLLFALPASAQSFRVQCPNSTNLHPATQNPDGSWTPAAANTGAIKCQEVGGSDGYATMGDGHQIYLFGFAPLSGIKDIVAGKPGTQVASDFNVQPAPLSFADVSGTSEKGAMKEPASIMNTGVLYANSPAPLMAIDEDDELFLTLSNVGMIMRPDLFEQHTVHFHGYANASSFFDGVPDASVAINIAGSFTYYYTAPEAGTYFWHCHIAPVEHLQMGMIGQLYVRPRQNRVPAGSDLKASLQLANIAAARPVVGMNPDNWDGSKCSDILCTGQTPLPATGATHVANAMYAYNDGDGSTRYDVEYPIQMMGFDPNFHYVGMTFNPESFVDLKDKYHMLSGRSYPDTINTSVNDLTVAGPLSTLGSDGTSRPSQPLPSLITIDKTNGQTRALLRISNLSVTEFSTLATLGIPMTVIAQNARLLRDMAGNNMAYDTNSITMGGGESMDVILDASNVPAGTYFLYSTNLDNLSNDAENFGGMMTEIVVK